MKPFVKLLLVGGAVLGGGYLLSRKMSETPQPPLPPGPSPVPKPVPPPKPPGPPPSPPSRPPRPTPEPQQEKLPIGTHVRIADASSPDGTMEMIVFTNVAGVDSWAGAYDYGVINADCWAGISNPSLCSVKMYIRTNQIISIVTRT